MFKPSLKKSITIIIATLAIEFVHSQANDEHFTIGLAPVMSFPVSSLKVNNHIGWGARLDLGIYISDRVTLTITPGSIYYGGKKDPNGSTADAPDGRYDSHTVTQFPVGIKYFFADRFYILAQAGAVHSFTGALSDGWGYTYSTGLGYEFENGLGFNVRYDDNAVKSITYNAITCSWIYRF